LDSSNTLVVTPTNSPCLMKIIQFMICVNL